MSYQNEDYANQDWDAENDQRSYEEQQRQPSDYDSSQDERKIKHNKGQESESQSQSKHLIEELESTASNQEDTLMLIDIISDKRKEQLGIQEQLEGENKHSNEERITSPFISKYEKASVIGKRAQQISKNSPIYVEISQDQLKKYTALHIAQMEFDMGRIPMIVRRYLPDNTFEDWKINQLKKLPF